MKMRSFFLLFTAIVMVACTGKQAETQKDEQPDMPPVGAITAYYATAEVDGPFEKLKAGDFIADNCAVFAPKIEESGDNYVFTWEPEYDDEEVTVCQIPKSSVTVKTIKPAWLAVADVEQGALFEAKNGDKIRIFRSNINGHTYPEPYSEARLTPEQQQNCLVMSVSASNKYDGMDMVLYSYFLLPEQDGFVSLYESRDGRLMPLLTSEFCAPYDWTINKGEAYDAQGNLLVNMELLEMPIADVIAWVPDEGAIYFNGTMFYRK